MVSNNYNLSEVKLLAFLISTKGLKDIICFLFYSILSFFINAFFGGGGGGDVKPMNEKIFRKVFNILKNIFRIHDSVTKIGHILE